MKKRYFSALLGLAISLSMGINAFAASWQQDGQGWRWQRDDGSSPANGWEWLDGNNDGIAECYYFNAGGYLSVNTVTPDGSTVNADGAWIVDGAVQHKNVGTSEAAKYNDDYSGIYALPYTDMDGNTTTETVTVVYDAGSNSITVTWSGHGDTQVYTYSGTEYHGWTIFELITDDLKDAILFSAPGVMEYYTGYDDTQSSIRS